MSVRRARSFGSDASAAVKLVVAVCGVVVAVGGAMAVLFKVFVMAAGLSMETTDAAREREKRIMAAVKNDDEKIVTTVENRMTLFDHRLGALEKHQDLQRLQLDKMIWKLGTKDE
jgi:hypothetical protein